MDRVDQVRQILSTRGLTLYRVSQQSVELFGRSSKFYIPHNLYHDLADPSRAPSIHQMIALSQITKYRLYDWLGVFGIDLDQIPRLQLMIPRKRTALLDSSAYDPFAWIPWFSDRPGPCVARPIAPLGQFLAAAPPRRAMDLAPASKGRFLYGKVGEEDVHAFPHLGAGSIFRVDTRNLEEQLLDAQNKPGRRLFFVEHILGWSCSQLVLLSKERILLHSPRNPCVQTELTLGTEARIAGVIDAEIRPLWHRPVPREPHRSTIPPRARPLSVPSTPTNLKDLLRNSRLRLGVSFREASGTSRWIAKALSDELYFAAPGTLSDYEALAAPPRHIQKIVTLCILYCVRFPEFLRASGLRLEEERREPIPDEFILRQMPNHGSGPHSRRGQTDDQESDGFLGSLLRKWEEVPLFLRHALNELAGLKNFSLLDVFWVDGEKPALHPLLVNAALVVINRRIKRPSQSAAKDCRAPSLHLILKRNGGYLFGCCALQEGTLLVGAYPGGPPGTQRFRNGIDAEIIGQVTAILRKLV